jgi:nitrogenase iron protein NifH
MRKIAIYGKGGIGKSTTTQNTVAALAEMGKKVMVVGCDPKADSTRLLLNGLAQKTVLDTLREEGEDVELDDIRREGLGKTMCTESGGPEPGVGCAGRGIITSINLLEQLGAYKEESSWTTCSTTCWATSSAADSPCPSAKARPRRSTSSVSGEMMAMYAANNICKGIVKFAEAGGVRLGGLICNSRKWTTSGDDRRARPAVGHADDPFRAPRQRRPAGRDQRKMTVIDFEPNCIPRPTSTARWRKRSTRTACSSFPKPLEIETLEKLLIDFGIAN